MIRQLLLVGRTSYPKSTPDIPEVDLSDPIDIKPIGWPETAGMSHRGYVLSLTSSQYQSLASRRRMKGVTLHCAGTQTNPIPTGQVLASLGLELGEDNG